MCINSGIPFTSREDTSQACDKTQYLLDHLVDNDNELVITSEDPIPVAIRNSEFTYQNELHNTHEEADVIIVNQLFHHTDVFVLLP